MTPTAVFAEHGVFDVRAIAAHGVWTTERDWEILAEKGVTVVHNPVSNLKLGSGVAPVPAMLEAGVNVALGTDGAVECGNLDMFELMRFFCCQEREKAGTATAMPASAALMMATFCGARAQGRSGECGMLQEGMDADIVLLDFSAPHLMPCHNVLNALLWSAKGGDVAMTMVRGKILYQNGQFPTLDLAHAVEELTTYAIPKLFAEEK